MDAMDAMETMGQRKGDLVYETIRLLLRKVLMDRRNLNLSTSLKCYDLSVLLTLKSSGTMESETGPSVRYTVIMSVLALTTSGQSSPVQFKGLVL
jgi:hypothetical protein